MFLNHIVRAVIIAVAVTLGSMAVGLILVTLPIPIAILVGNFIKTYASAFGVLAGLWYFFRR